MFPLDAQTGLGLFFVLVALVMAYVLARRS